MEETERRAVLAQARRAARRAAEEAARSARLRAHSERLQDTIKAVGYPRWFVVEGVVDGTVTRARWYRGRLMLPSSWAARAALVVALGERYEVPERDDGVVASLDEPLPALLTVLRACDRPQRVSFGPAHLEQPPSGRSTTALRP